MIKSRIIFMILSVAASYSFGADEVIYATKINKLYAQSKEGSTAHLIRIDAVLPSACNDNRLYIDFEDTDLYSAALASYLAEKNVDLVYNSNSSSRLARRHLSTSCKLISLF